MEGSPLPKEFYAGAASPSNIVKFSPKYSVYSEYDRQNWSPSMSPTTS